MADLYYRVSNLRKLQGMEKVNIRPITILLGRNSAGKSTFLRSFPLMRQSIETKASAPVLWWGDYVDFGSYRSAVRGGDLGLDIDFEFELRNLSVFKGRLTAPRPSGPTEPEVDVIDNVSLSISLGSDHGETRYRSIKVSTSETNLNLTMVFSENPQQVSEILVGGVNLCQEIPGFRAFFFNESIFETPYFVRLRPSQAKGGTQFIGDGFRQVLNDYLVTELTAAASKQLGRQRIQRVVSDILKSSVGTKTQFKDICGQNGVVTIRRLYAKLDASNSAGLRGRVIAAGAANNLLRALYSAMGVLTEYFANVEYIGPARVRSERFYRQQELQVSQISPDGQNLPIFLASLNESEIVNFSNWVSGRFGYGVEVEKSEAHVSINLTQEGRKVNVIDTGYGVSQILPVLAQIWWMRQPGRRRRLVHEKTEVRPTLLIEQPELHLHPAHQALIADVMAHSITDSEAADPITLVVETHSEALVNRLGELVASRVVSPDDVQIVVFGSDDASDSISLSGFDADGALVNWPFGFFNYNSDDYSVFG